MFLAQERSLQAISLSGASQALCILGAVHGDEPAGVHALEALSSLVANKDWVIGELDVFGLVGNPDAYAQGVRFIDFNLNRMFQDALLEDQKNQAVEVQRAREIRDILLELKKGYATVYVIDMHSVSVSDIQMTVYKKNDDSVRSIVESVSPIPLSFVFDESCVPGSTLRCAEMVGCVGFTIEAGNHSSPNAMLVALDIIERFIVSRATFLSKKTTYVGRALYASGERRTYVTLEKILPQDKFEFTVDQVSELFLPQGTVFGRNNNGPVVATRDCYMMMPSKIPNEQDFDAGFLCTRT